MKNETVIVLDFGGQYNQLIARRVRECNVYCEIYSYKKNLEEIKAMNPKGIILTGGPNSAYEADSPTYDKELFELGIPVLGICYGSQLMMHLLGGTVEKAPVREYGKIEVTVDTTSQLFTDISEKTICWMSHNDYISKAAPEFDIIAHTADCPVAAVQNVEKKLYADENQGSARKNAKGLLLYLDIGLPHRGSVDVLKLLKSAYTMVFNKEVRIQEWSVTSNLPSMMNGGKDFCEWSKRDRELASKVGRIVEFVLGKYGKGLVNLALAESFLEKSGDNYEVATLAAKGRMQAEAGGKIEQCFVADGILAWLHLQNGKPQEALEVLNGIEGKAEKEEGQNLLPNIYAFETRCSLYRGDRACVTGWMENAPDENVEFRIYDRFIYLTKVRVYLQSGRNEQAYSLLTKLRYYAEMMSRTYIGIECSVLMAVALQRLKNDDWKKAMCHAIDTAMEYSFTRIISREGAAVNTLINTCGWKVEKDGADDKEIAARRAYFRQLQKETESMTRYYPGYMKAGVDDVQLSETATAILKLQAEGLSRQKIADRLNMSEANVKYHLNQVYRKLGVTDKAGAVREASNRGLI